jgi:hypothetical protein
LPFRWYHISSSCFVESSRHWSDWKFLLPQAAATYLIGTCGVDYLGEIAYLDVNEDLDAMIKGVNNPGVTVTTG